MEDAKEPGKPGGEVVPSHGGQLSGGVYAKGCDGWEEEPAASPFQGDHSLLGLEATEEASLHRPAMTLFPCAPEIQPELISWPKLHHKTWQL